MNLLALVYNHKGDFNKGLEIHLKSYNIMKEFVETDLDSKKVSCLINVSSSYLNIERHDLAK